MISLCLAVIMLGTASYFDIKTHKVPNAVSLSGIGISIILLIIDSALNKSYINILTALICIVALFLVSILKILGAGDIKLLMAISAFSGPTVMLITVGSGSIVVILFMLIRSRKKALVQIKGGILSLLNKRIPTEGDKVPFAPFMFVGYVIAMMVCYFGFNSLWM